MTKEVKNLFAQTQSRVLDRVSKARQFVPESEENKRALTRGKVKVRAQRKVRIQSKPKSVEEAEQRFKQTKAYVLNRINLAKLIPTEPPGGINGNKSRLKLKFEDELGDFDYYRRGGIVKGCKERERYERAKAKREAKCKAANADKECSADTAKAGAASAGDGDAVPSDNVLYGGSCSGLDNRSNS